MHYRLSNLANAGSSLAAHVCEGKTIAEQLPAWCIEEMLKNGCALKADFELSIWAGFWARGGFPVVAPSDLLSASYSMCSIPSECARAPWPKFAVALPRGLFVSEEGDPAELVIVDWTVDFYRSIVLFDRNPDGGRELRLDSGRMPSCAVRADLSHSTGELLVLRSDERLLDAINRLVAGIACHPTIAEAPSKRSYSGAPKKRFGQPTTWDFKLCDPVSFDARPALRSYLREGKSPTVQGIVRGHWKRQPCGENRLGRKMIHVEPYWRGPEDAPIVVRERRMG